MGPHYANFRVITDDLCANDAIRIASREELSKTLLDLLSHPAESAAMGVRAKQVFEAQAGATGRSVRAIQELLTAQGPTA